MLTWFMSLPWPFIVIAIVGLFVAIGVGGLTVTQRVLMPRFGDVREQVHVTGFLHHGILIVYGLAVALLAVAVWEKNAEVRRVVADEAVSIGVLYRDVSAYPEPARDRLQDILASYTEQIFRDAWPTMQRGEIPTEGVRFMDELQQVLYKFEPATQGQMAMHQEALRAYNALVHERRLRLDSVSAELAAPLWFVVWIGALLTIASAWFFKVESASLHRVMVALLAGTLGLVLFLISYFDRPIRGTHGITPEPYELIHEQLMKR